jgi:hypothetical protein
MGQAIGETLFDAVYLLGVVTLGILMLVRSRKWDQYRWFGVMAVVLGSGDSFHLIPRLIALWGSGLETNAVSLGIGKLITSLTMTVFYVILFYIWRQRYQVQGKRYLDLLMWACALARVILCCFPQNEWTSAHPNLLWGILRNIPFALLGLEIIVLFLLKAKEDKPFRFMALTIILSFGFYIPVVIWAETVPWVGSLMIPKTCAYVWTVLIGFRAQRKDLAASAEKENKGENQNEKTA